MCKCTPSLRTPFCGAPTCEWPEQALQAEVETIEKFEPLELLEIIHRKFARSHAPLEAIVFDPSKNMNVSIDQVIVETLRRNGVDV